MFLEVCRSPTRNWCGDLSGCGVTDIEGFECDLEEDNAINQ